MYYILYCVSPIINRIIVIVIVFVIAIAIAIAITIVTIYYYYDYFNPKKSKEYHHQQHFVIELK